jgi:hypothetical protein
MVTTFQPNQPHILSNQILSNQTLLPAGISKFSWGGISVTTGQRLEQGVLYKLKLFPQQALPFPRGILPDMTVLSGLRKVKVACSGSLAQGQTVTEAILNREKLSTLSRGYVTVPPRDYVLLLMSVATAWVLGACV